MVRRIDTEAVIDNVRFEDQASAVATPAAGFSNLYTRETGTAHGGLYLLKSTGEDIGPFITGTAAAGGGDSTFTDTFANIPGASNDGDLFLPSDGFSLYRDTGAAWVPWGPNFPFIEPVDGDFAWINQAGASVDTTFGGIYLNGPQAGALNYRVRKKAAPSVPYVITVAFIPHLYGLAKCSAGIGFRQSSDGKMAILRLVGETNKYSSDKLTDASTFGAVYVNALINLVGSNSVVWMRIADNNTNRIVSWSADGQHWFDLHTVGRTDWLTADEVLFFVEVGDATYGSAMTLVHWKET